SQNWFTSLKKGLTATRNQFVKKVNNLIFGGKKLDEQLLSELEEVLITSDVGVSTTMRMIDDLRQELNAGRITQPEQLREALKQEIFLILNDTPHEINLEAQNPPTVILIVGVNGTGKTTTIGKLASREQQDGKKVLIAAADTFRAAAIDQLDIWANRAGCDMVKHQPGSDPAAVVFDAIAASKARKSDILIIDTAGRLHTKFNLMEELKKIQRVISRELPNSTLEILLVLDATTGQNAVSQAKLFKNAIPVTGLILTKLDGTAKGGIIITIRDELHLPVKLIGIGEAIDDLRDFSPQDFVAALFATE
ncbi:MAG: signal recognition particle-docking protein FtsY, partial [bacterium]|nr:signal recognition particle-docking protein FtsY [bacterium]